MSVSMDNVHPEGSEDQSATSPSVASLGSNIHVRHSENIRNVPQRYYPGFGAARECNNDNVSSIVYKI